MRVSFKVHRHGKVFRSDELLSARGLDDEERELLKKLADGVRLEDTETQHKEAVATLMQNLHSKMWQPRVSIIDWTLFGFVKGATCKLLEKAEADSWIIHCAHEAEALSRSVDLQIDTADDQEIEFTCSYTSRSYPVILSAP